MDRCGSFPLLSAPHSLFSIWTDLKRSEKIPGAPAWRWGEWIWLTVPSRLHWNSPQGLNISYIRVFDQIRYPEIPITLRPLDGHIDDNYLGEKFLTKLKFEPQISSFTHGVLTIRPPREVCSTLVCVSMIWWLRPQGVKLEIWGSNSSIDTNFSLNNYHYVFI